MLGWSGPSTRSCRPGSARAAGSPARPGPPPGRRAARLFRDPQGVGVVRAQHPLEGGQGLLVQRIASAARPAARMRRRGCPRAQGVGVVRPLRPLPDGHGPLVQRDRLRGPARRRAGVARLFREVRVSGWSGPSTRSRSARVRSSRGSPRRPARPPVGGGEVVPRLQGVGVVRAQHPLPVGQILLEQRDRLGGPARILVAVGEVVQRGGGVGVVRA